MAKPATGTKKKPARKAPAKRPVSLKTKATKASVDGFIEKLDAKRRDDARAIDAMFTRIVGEPGKMWGPSIIGYGSRRLRYPSGRELDWMQLGWSPRAQSLTLYVLGDNSKQRELLGRLGPHGTGKGCLYIKRLADIDLGVLEKVVRAALNTP